MKILSIILFAALLMVTTNCDDNNSLTAIESECNYDTVENYDWERIPRCIQVAQTKYSSNIEVKHSECAEIVFTYFMNSLRWPFLYVLRGGTDWQLEYAEPDGTYREVKYWKIFLSYVPKGYRERYIAQLFHVSEKGDVVLLQGCV